MARRLERESAVATAATSAQACATLIGAADSPFNALTVGVSLVDWTRNDVGILVGTADGAAEPRPTYQHNERIVQTVFITGGKRFFQAVEPMAVRC